MKELKKQFQTKDVTLAAYYTCMCNYLPCPCNDMRSADGPMKSATEATFSEIQEIEDASWNN